MELTRTGNYICDQVRKYIDPMFRAKQGVLLITIGPNMEFSNGINGEVEYRGVERGAMPYPGLQKF